MKTTTKPKKTIREEYDWPSDDQLLAPAAGWDNACDVREGVKLCRALRYALSNNPVGHGSAHALADKLRNFGLSRKTAFRLILKHNKPLMTRGKLAECIGDVWTNAANPPGMWSLARRPDFNFEEDELPEDDSWMEGGQGRWPHPVDYDVKQNDSSILAEFLAARPGKLIRAADGVIYSLGAGGVWRARTEQEIAVEFRETDPDLKFDASKITRIVRGLHVDAARAALPFEWIETPDNAPAPSDIGLFRNGLLDTSNGVLLPHDGKLLVTGTPDFDFDSAAECPRWLAFLDETLDASFCPTLQELLGYILVPDTSAHAIFVLSGVKRGGKSTVMHVAESLVGRQHVASRTLNDLAGDFGLEGIGDAKLLTIPDASETQSSRRATAVERLKTISGGDIVSVNRKGKEILNQRVPARILLACNALPRMLDESGALASRFVQIVFERSFLGKEDRDLGAKLDAELPGIANWALVGLERLRANGGRFTIGKAGASAQRRAAEAQSPTLRFAKACLAITADREDFAPLDVIFPRYYEWAIDEGLASRQRRNRDELRADLVAAFGSRIKYGRRRWHDPAAAPSPLGKRCWGFSGVALRASSDSAAST